MIYPKCFVLLHLFFYGTDGATFAQASAACVWLRRSRLRRSADAGNKQGGAEELQHRF